MSNITVINLGCSESEDEIPQPVTQSKRTRVTRSMSRRKRGRSTTNRSAKGISTTPIEILDDGSVNGTEKNKKKKTIMLDDGLEISVDDISDEETDECIRVLWQVNSEVERFNLKPSETLHSIFESLSKKYNQPLEQIKLRNGDNVVSMYDTVRSLNLKVTQVLEGLVVKQNMETCTQESSGKIKIKCLLNTTKKPLIFFLHPNQDFSCVLKECAKETGCLVSDVKLKFDGENVSTTDTPKSLDLEGDECFDVHTK